MKGFVKTGEPNFAVYLVTLPSYNPRFRFVDPASRPVPLDAPASRLGSDAAPSKLTRMAQLPKLFRGSKKAKSKMEGREANDGTSLPTTPPVPH